MFTGAEMYRVSAAGNVPLRAAVPAGRGGLIDVACDILVAVDERMIRSLACYKSVGGE